MLLHKQPLPVRGTLVTRRVYVPLKPHAGNAAGRDAEEDCVCRQGLPDGVTEGVDESYQRGETSTYTLWNSIGIHHKACRAHLRWANDEHYVILAIAVRRH